MGDYEMIKDSLFIRPINFYRNEKALDGMVYRIVGDIALTLCIKISETKSCVTSIKVSEELVKKWGDTVEKIFNEALYNTYEMAPPRIFLLEKVLHDPKYGGEDFMKSPIGFEINKDADGNCLSTMKYTNGAVAVFLPGVADRLGKLLGEDFYIAFTSIHEVMIHNDRKVDVDDLVNILEATIRKNTPDEDFLSARIYHYCRSTSEISCLI